jgi:polysaccharide biosynthesis/export protein
LAVTGVWRVACLTVSGLSLLAMMACTRTPWTPPATADAGAAGATNGGAVLSADQYIIGSGDELSVFVYRNPDLSEAAVAVRPDGKISVPLIEDIQAAGKTPSQLSREVEDRLKKYIQDPNVTIIVRSFLGPLDRQIRVIGEATDPQAIPFRDHLTLLDVMIATKGLTKYAAGNRAVLVRREPGGKETSITVHLSDLIKNGDISQNMELQPGDTLIIPQSWF